MDRKDLRGLKKKVEDVREQNMKGFEQRTVSAIKDQSG